MSLIVLLIFLIPLGLSSALIFHGIRGYRVGDHPVCRRCGYDLFGLPAETAVCGECGGSLGLPRSVVIGHRKRRPTFIVAGLVLLVPVLFVGGIVLWGALNSTNWMAIAPTRLVIWLAGSAKASRRTPALAELSSEITAGSLSANDTNHVADAGLAYQSDLAKPWDASWGDLLEGLQSNGKLSDARWKLYLTRASQGNYALKIRPRVRRGDPLPYVVESSAGRAGDVNRLWMESIAVGVDWLGPFGIVPLHGIMGGGVSATLGGSWTSAGGSSIDAKELPPGMPDGIQQLRFSGNFKVGFPASPGRIITPIITGQINLTAHFTLLPADQPTVKIIDDPSLAAAIRKSLRPNVYRSTFGSFSVVVDGPPVGISFDVFKRANGKETKIGSFACPAGTTAHSYVFAAVIPAGPKNVDVIFRSNINPALNTIDTFEMWQGKIVFLAVPVK